MTTFECDSHKDFKWNTERNEWNATVFYKDGIPIQVSYYIWSVSEENFKKSMQEAIGQGYKLANNHCGNGHGDADIVPV